MMAEEPDEHEVTPQGAPIDGNWFYDVPYFMSSWHIQSNAMGVRDLYPDFSVPIRFKTGSDNRLCEQAEPEPKRFRFSTVSKSQSLQSLSYVGLQRGWHARLGDDDQSAAVWVALPVSLKA